MRLQVIVEGHGEEEAARLLVRNILHRGQRFDVEILKPQRRRDIRSLLSGNGGNLLRYQEVAESDSDAVLWLLDHDDGCVRDTLGEIGALLAVRGVRRPTAFSFVVPEFENLFLENPSACVEYFVAYGIPEERFAEGAGRRDAKGHISKALPKGVAYKPSVDQVRITARLNFERLEDSSPSFRHLIRSLTRLLGGITDGSASSLFLPTGP